MKKNSTEFYNKISSDYDILMAENTNGNRAQTRSLFKELVPQGSKVLDFGGGTGTDAVWLTENGYQVTFVDNAAKMTEQARIKIKKANLDREVYFLKGADTDFNNWQFDRPIFDAILANNSVVNSITSIDQLFLKFSKVLHQNGILIITQCNMHTILKNKKNKLKYLFSKVLNKKLIVSIHFEESSHQTIIYSDQEIAMASQTYFELIKKQALLGDALLLCLRKK